MDLLEYLAGKAGCMYLSDLLRAPQIHVFIRKALQKTKPEDFILADWQEAADYLHGPAPRFVTAQEARAYLLRQAGDCERRQ